MKRALLWINVIAAAVVVVGVFVQVYLIASYASGAGEDALDLHEVIGYTAVHGAELVVFLTALGAYWRSWRWIGWSFLLFALGTAQIFLAPPDEDPASGWVHGLHGLFALFVLVLAAVILHHGLRLLRRGAPAAESAAPPPPRP